MEVPLWRAGEDSVTFAAAFCSALASKILCDATPALLCGAQVVALRFHQKRFSSLSHCDKIILAQHLRVELVYFVRGRGLEPPRIAPRGPKPRASTNFATRASEASIAKFLSLVRPLGLEPRTVWLRASCSTN